MADSPNYSALASYFSAPHVPTGGANDIAKAILLNANVNRGINNAAPAPNGPSLMSRIFDVLSRPNYAVANFAKGIAQGNPNLADIGTGLAGQDKTTFSDVLGELGAPKSPGRAIAGMAMDIGLDPTSYIPVAGLISKLKPLIKGGEKAVEAVAPEVTKLQQFTKKGELTNPEVFGLPAKPAVSVPEALTAKAAESAPVIPRDALAPGPALSKQMPLDLPGVAPRLPIPKITDTAAAFKTVEDASAPLARTVGQLPLGLTTESGDKSLRALMDSGALKDTAPQVVDKAFAGDPAALSKVAAPVRGVEFEPRHANIADQLLQKFDPAKSTARINQQFPDTLNAKQQVWLYHRAIDAAKGIVKKPEWVASHANKIYAAVEDALKAKGYTPRLGSGENVSIYDVIKQMGGPGQAKAVLDSFAKDLKPESPIWDAVQGLRAANVIDDSKSVKYIADAAAEARATVQASGSLSDAGEKNIMDSILNLAKQATKTAPISPSAQDTARKLLNVVMQSGKPPAQVAIEHKASMINDILSKGRGPRTELNRAVTLGLEKNLGNLPSWAIDGNKAVEFFMGRVATWWGQKDLRPLTLNAIGGAAATAAARGKALNSLFKGFNDAQRAEALAVAQGVMRPTSIHTARLADEISKMMSNLVGQVSGSSVVFRSAVDREMLNKWMRNYSVGFQFTTESGVRDLAGQLHDFSKGTDWVNSWKIAATKENPQIFLFKLQQAMEQATREKALFDELGERFGQKIPGGGYKIKIEGHPYLEGYHFPEDIAKQIPRVVKDWTNPVHMSDPLMRHYDRLLSMWKSGVTIYRPAHHIRNFIGDAYLGWMDGVNTVRPYILAARVQRTMKDMYPTLADVDKLVELGVAGKSMSTPHVGEVIFRNKSGIAFTAQQIAAVAHQKGLLEHARSIEDIIDLGEQSRFKPFGGKVQTVARSASELISHNSRLAHFIDKVAKSRGSDLEKIFEEAGRRARKWHPTGLDLTPFERKFMRRIMPFYSWLRKSTPLLIEGLVMHPGKALTASKVYGGIQEAQGMQTGGREDPFPVDQMFPKWIRAEGIGPLSSSIGWLGKISNQETPGYVMAGQGLNPLTQMVSQLSQPGNTILSGLTPAAQIPIALTTGSNPTTGVPISGVDAKPGAMQEYLGAQIPVWSMAQGITGVTPFGTQTKKAAGGGNASPEAILNWLAASGIKGTGPYIKQAQYEYKHPIKVDRNAAKADFLNQLKGQ